MSDENKISNYRIFPHAATKIEEVIVDYMSHNSPSGIVVVGEMRTVTLSTGITGDVWVIDWLAEVYVYLSGVNKTTDVMLTT